MRPLRLLLSTLLLGLTLSSAPLLAADEAPTVEVYKSPQCGCCGKWAAHLEAHGFKVNTHDMADLPAARKALGMPDRYASCHSAKVGGYAIEGHVPAGDIRRLLAERPAARGLAVPGMPAGSPGMESAHPQPYQTLLIGQDGSAGQYARH